jgi:hypothetical protein
MVLEGITSTNIIHIRGQFPKVRYFSYQVSNCHTRIMSKAAAT